MCASSNPHGEPQEPAIEAEGDRARCSCGWEWIYAPEEDLVPNRSEEELQELVRTMAETHWIHDHDRRGTISMRERPETGNDG